MPTRFQDWKPVRPAFTKQERPSSIKRIATFAGWFAEQEYGWKDARKERSTDMMLVLLKDTKLNVVRLGYRTSGGGWSVTDQPMRFVPQVWARIS